MYTFKQARAIWGENLKNELNQFLGFFTEINLRDEQEILIAIAARSLYRLFVNDQFFASGPARTAHGYCRVDEIRLKVTGNVRIAIEVVAFNKPGKYSNDCTLEPGLLVAEITDSAGEVISATGDGPWRYQELLSRRSLVELMSHCREIVECYDLDETSFDWRKGCGEFSTPVLTDYVVKFLPRRAPYANYRPIPMETLEQISDIKQTKCDVSNQFQLVQYVNKSYYQAIPKENLFLDSIFQESDAPFTGRYQLSGQSSITDKSIILTPGQTPTAITFGRKKSELGFIDFNIKVTEECCVDVINSDHLTFSGELSGNSYVTRYNLKPGNYHLTTFEPKLVRYIKIIMRTAGIVTLNYPVILDDTYPDDRDAFFSCSDGELNAIYEASRRTLRLNTLDIFMDCPERERGGWLCDSHFSSQSAWQMFGDLTVERDFLENFMLTDGTKKWQGFFPEVYPGSLPKEESVGIMTWSFWLLTELFDYYHRSGDREFIDACRGRVDCFIQGLLSLRGESGLLEGLTVQFVDWSLSNNAFNLQPINIPNNCLAVRMLEAMAELYDQPDWRTAADEMRVIIDTCSNWTDIFASKGDGASYDNGQLRRSGCVTESGVAYEIWSGFHLSDKAYINSFVNTMGYSPRYRSDPNIGKANIFIGLMVRFDILARLGKTETLVRELKDIYLAELRDGSATFFENYNAFSGCHAVNGLIGTLLTNHVLGLGQPSQLTKTVKISPNPCGLRWAQGAAQCSDGRILLNFKADQDEHLLDIQLNLPDGWRYELAIPFELCGWMVLLNGNVIKKKSIKRRG